MTALRIHKQPDPGSALRARGLSLIELMIAMVLGLVVVAAAAGVLLANKRVYATTATLNRIQENTRVAFEIMSRDLREAGGNPCGGAIPIVSQLESGDNSWWAQYADGLHGYAGNQAAAGTATGTADAQRVDGTDAIDLHMANSGDIRVTEHTNPAAVLNVTTTAGLSDNDILMVCNNSYAMIFQAAGLSGTGVKIGHGGGNNGTNCSNEFQFERNCVPGASGDRGYCFVVPAGSSVNPNCDRHSRSPATVVQVQSFRWYIGNNARGGRSLYRATLVNEGATVTPTATNTIEVAEGVSDMQLMYRSNGATNFVVATAVADWGAVNAVQVGLTVQGAEGAVQGGYLEGTDGEVMSRQLTHIVALRNKAGVL